MSAWIGTDAYLDYFGSPGSTEQGGVRSPVKDVHLLNANCE